MFRNSEPSKDASLFSGVTQHMRDRKLRDFSDEKAWHNVFYHELTSKIDESIFQALYSSNEGRPNSPIRILVGMILLKEGQDWTDEQLYENCRYNMSVMRALGLTNIDDEVPVASTYYDFKSKLVDHFSETGKNLFKSLFHSITSAQVKRYNVSGKSIRMDSKLIQSNIRIGSQLHKVLQAVQVFCRGLPEGWEKRVKKKADKKFLAQIMAKSVTNHLYGMTTEEKRDWLRRLGFMMRKMLNIFRQDESTHHVRLEQMYKEHYVETGEKQRPCRPKEKNEMKSDGLQSMHDPDATYRTKGRGRQRQQVSGFSANITETTEGDLRLITDVQVEKATHSDGSYLEPAAKNTVKLTGQQIEQIHTDGGYDSIENRLRFSEHIGTEWHLAKGIGGSYGYQYKMPDDETILIYDPCMGKWLEATLSRGGRYRIRGQSGRFRYFKKEQVHSAIALQHVRPEKIEKGIRANAESTINQVFHTLRAGKSKYRGLMRNKLFVFSRSIWVNCKRIGAVGLQNNQFFELWTLFNFKTIRFSPAIEI